MLVGQKIGPFIVQKEIGSGAMGAVYRAKHEETGKRVAIKVVAPGLATNENSLRRFHREASILKQLKHPNIVRLYATGKFHGTPFYAMEYVEGESLDRVIARRGRLTWEEVVALGQQLCAALRHAHEHGIVHRDLKPSNLMVLADGTVKLMDFGIAKDLDRTQLTAANCTVGTAAYMSPEQCRGEREITHKSDLYSFGVMLYELVTGRKPFEADNAMEMFLKHNNDTFERPSRFAMEMPIWLDTLICQLMEKSAEKRPLDAYTVGATLQQIQERVEAQQSAGVEAAKRRRIDRSRHDPELDEEDREIARSLVKKKKKKKKKVPFYQAVWFQASGLGLLLLVVVYVLYATLIKAPSADYLFEQAQELRLDDPAAAREGPIRNFLYYYPDDPRSETVLQWKRGIDRDVLNRQLQKRRDAGWKARGKEEEAFREAMADEDRGDLEGARKQWKKLLIHKHSTDPEHRSYALLGKKYLGELDRVDEQYEKVKTMVKRERTFEKKEKGASELEELALQAVRLEQQGRMDDAASIWSELKEQTKGKEEERNWYLLAAERVRTLRLPIEQKKGS